MHSVTVAVAAITVDVPPPPASVLVTVVVALALTPIFLQADERTPGSKVATSGGILRPRAVMVGAGVQPGSEMVMVCVMLVMLDTPSV